MERERRGEGSAPKGRKGQMAMKEGEEGGGPSNYSHVQKKWREIKWIAEREGEGAGGNTRSMFYKGQAIRDSQVRD